MNKPFNKQTLVRLAQAAKRIKEIEERERCEQSFYEFLKCAWPHFDPAPFSENWHLKDICEHLEAVARGYIPRLLLNEPPRTGKTAIVSICFPAWVWAQPERAPLLGPQVSFFYASYAEQLSLEHSLKTRRLIESRWYRKHWGKRFSLVSDRNTKGHFENDQGGYRMASSVDARAAGFGADILVADDPHLVKEAESELVREGVVRWWSETMPSRLNNRQTGAMIVVMQRVHEGDLSGFILANDLGYVHFCVPMCYVPCKHINAWEGDKIVTVIGDDIDQIDDDDVFWVDPRTDDGELLWPARFPASEVAKLEKELGPYAFCTPAESPVLMADLSLRPISEVKVGDMVVGFQIGDDARRARLRPSKVLAVSKSLQPVNRIALDSGAFARCTADHRWFTGRNDVSHKPYKAAQVGTPLKRVCPAKLPMLDDEEARLAGWVAGFFDGEGSASVIHRREHECSVIISFHQSSQQNLPLCEKLEAALDRLGFHWGCLERQPTTLSAAGIPWQRRRQYYLKAAPGNGKVKGNRAAKRASKLSLNQRFIELIQPVKWRNRIIDSAVNGRMYTTEERVLSITPDGIEDVFGLTTETGNYVVWGLASSNSGQLQQTPAPRGGGIIREEWWQDYTDEIGADVGATPGQYPPCEYILASLDTAYTEKEENDPSALSVWGVWRDKSGNPQIILMVCWQERLQIHELVSKVAADCQRFKVDRLIIEDKAAGHSVGQELGRLFGHFDFGIELVNPRTGFIKSPDKVARLQTVVHLFAEGLIWAPDKSWADEMIKQCALVPRAIHDDLADSMSQALIYLRRAGWAVRKEERAIEIEDEVRYRPRAGALYPA